MRMVFGLVALMATSCISTEGVAQSFTAPDGSPAFLVRCGGVQRTIANCHEKAREMCMGNYRELNRSITQREYKGGSTENRQIEIVCEG